MAATVYTSAQPLMALLNESDVDLQGYALDILNAQADDFWSELTDSLHYLEDLAENEKYIHRAIAAEVVSKVYFHMDELDEALRFALSSNILLDETNDTPFRQAVVTMCVDAYVTNCQAKASRADALRRAAEQSSMEDVDIARPIPIPAEPTDIDPRIAATVSQLIENSASSGAWSLAVGLCVQTRDLPRLEALMARTPNPAPLMKHLLDMACSASASRHERDALLRLLVRLYRSPAAPSTDAAPAAAARASVEGLAHVSDVLGLCVCLLLLGESDEAADTLALLCGSASEEDHLLALQVAYDMAETQQQHFLARVATKFSAAMSLPDPTAAPAAAPAAAATGVVTTSGPNIPCFPPTPTETGAFKSSTALPLPANVSAPAPAPALPLPARLLEVLTGAAPARLHLSFLHHHCHADTGLFDHLKQTMEPRNHTLHGALSAAAGLAFAGTRRDEWFRKHWDWLEGGINWSRFTGRAALGAVYRGDTAHALDSMAGLMPGNTAPAGNAANAAGRKYAESGALFGLGLASAGLPNTLVPVIAPHVSSACEVTRHGACLGVGLAGLGSANLELFEELREALLSESAVTGEAAGYAIGCLFAGLLNDHDSVARELLAYARNSPHDKTVRGAGIGLALMCVGLRERAEWLYTELISDQAAGLRYCGAYAVALAHLGAGDTPALSLLLRLAVSDGDDDVRRAATTGAGLALSGHPDVLVRVLAPLAESHLAAVRHGAALALGLCAGQSDVPPRVASACVATLGRLCEDKQEVVRQAAFMGMGMAAMCATDPSPEQPEVLVKDAKSKAKADAAAAAAADAKAKTTGKTEDKVTAAKAKAAKELRWTPATCLPRQLRPLLQQQLGRRGDALAKLGALHAAGLTEAGGRNAALSLRTARGQPRLAAAVGVTLFLQSWFWLPLAPALCLAMAPQAVIGVTATGRVPTDWSLCVEGSVRATGYADLSSAVDTAEAKVKVLHALSQTRKAGVAAKAAKREQKELEKKQQDAEAKAAAAREAKKLLNAHLKAGLVAGRPVVQAHNPLRVPAAVHGRLRAVLDQRYRPARAVQVGVVMLRDSQPELPEEPVQQEAPVEEAAETVAEAPAAAETAEIAETAAAAVSPSEEPETPKPFQM